MAARKVKYDAFDDRQEGFLLYSIMKGRATVRQLQASGINGNITERVKPFLNEGIIREAKGDERLQLYREGTIPIEAANNGKIKVYVPNFDVLAQKCAEYNLIDRIFSPAWDLAKKISEDRKKGVDLITAVLNQIDFEKITEKIKSPEDAANALNNIPKIMKSITEGNPELSSTLGFLDSSPTEANLKKSGMPPDQIRIWKKTGGKFDKQSNVPKEVIAIVKAYLRIGFDLFEQPILPEDNGKKDYLTKGINDFTHGLKLVPSQQKTKKEKPPFEFKQTEKNFIAKVGEARLVLDKEKSVQSFNKRYFPTLNEIFKAFPDFFLIYHNTITALIRKENLSPQAAEGINKLKGAFYEKYENREEAFLEALKGGG